MPTEKALSPIYELKITLTEIEPPIWRRLQVPSTLKLCCLHSAFQVVMGWTDSHLYQFEKYGKYWECRNTMTPGISNCLMKAECRLVNYSRPWREFSLCLRFW